MDFPIVHLLKNDKNIYADSESKQQSSPKLLHIFNDSIIIDSIGQKFTIKKAKIKSWAFFFGYHPFYKGRRANIDFDYKSVNQISLNEFKDIITEKLNTGVGKSFWYTKKDIPRLKERVMKAESYKGVIEIFLYDAD